MYKFRFIDADNINQYDELIKEFLQPDQYFITNGDSHENADFEYHFKGSRDEVKRQIFRDLASATGKSPKWGILTGIRPVKLAAEIADRGTDPLRELCETYLLDESKISLTGEILNYQRSVAGKPPADSLSVYIGIPFCPTRCLYCSFTSNQVSDEEICRYLEALKKEIRYAGDRTYRSGSMIESIYFGGGTPTTLTAEQMDSLLNCVCSSFDLSGVREFTVEAGRPDTITDEKLRVLKEYGVNRISINPQSMKQSTLELIGRRHTVEDVYRAFEQAAKSGFETVNADLIAGLPEETFDDFADSTNKVISLGASNVTLHTLAVKRASRLKEMDENFNYHDEILRENMLSWAHKALRDQDFRPYYLYRQKHTSGNTENTGFCLEDRISYYNIRIMEEAQSILALGAGGISKIYFPEENRLERVANVSNYEIYIERIDEMIDRKERGFFL